MAKNIKNQKKRLTVSIDKEYFDLIVFHSKRNGVTKSEYLNLIFDEAFNRGKKPKTREDKLDIIILKLNKIGSRFGVNLA
jgi:hypothetical protein